MFIGVSRHSKRNVCRISIVSARPAKKENLTQRLLLHAPSVVAFARPALGCAHTVGFTDVFIARDGPPQQQQQRPPNKVLQDQTPSVSPAELLLSRETRRTLAELRTNKSPLLVSYLFSIGDPRHPSPLCPLCLMHDHTFSHLFECKSLPTSLSSLDLWTNPDKVEPFLATWLESLLAAT